MINPPQVLPEEPTAVTPHGGICGSKSQQRLRYPTVWSCGMVTGLIHDIPTCKELIDRIMTEAEAIIRSRLESVLAA